LKLLVWFLIQQPRLDCVNNREKTLGEREIETAGSGSFIEIA